MGWEAGMGRKQAASPKAPVEEKDRAMQQIEAQALLAQFEQARSIAGNAKAKYERHPIVKAAGGQQYPSPYFKIWNEATQNMVRLARLLRQEGIEPVSLDDELDKLLKS